MLDKLQYDNLYKFVASFGVAVIIAGFASPLASLADISDLIMSQQVYTDLSQHSKDIVDAKISLILSAYSFSQRYAIWLVLSGSSLLCIALIGWNRRQNVADSIEDANLNRALGQMRDKSPVEQAADEKKEEAEAMRSEVSIPEETTPTLAASSQQKASARLDSAPLRHQYRMAELNILRTLQSQAPNDTIIKHDQKIGYQSYDILLLRKNLDIVVEVKLFLRSIPKSRFFDAIWAHIERTAYYSARTSREAYPVVVLVLADANDIESGRSMVKASLAEYGQPVKVLTTTMDTIGQLTFSDFVDVSDE